MGNRLTLAERIQRAGKDNTGVQPEELTNLEENLNSITSSDVSRLQTLTDADVTKLQGIDETRIDWTGWGDYADDEYTSSNTFSMTADTDYDLPNNSQSGVTSQVPDDITTFYVASYLEVDDVTGFVSGETITGGTSSDTAVITTIDSVNNYLFLETITGDFQDAETITGGTSSTEATSVGSRVAGKITGSNGDGLNILVDFKAKPTTASSTRIDVWVDIGGSVGELYRRTITLSKGQNIEHGITMSVAGYTLDTWESNGGIVYVRANAATDIYDIRVVLTRTHKGRD